MENGAERQASERYAPPLPRKTGTIFPSRYLAGKDMVH